FCLSDAILLVCICVVSSQESILLAVFSASPLYRHMHFFLYGHGHLRALHSFPTRRSSDLRLTRKRRAPSFAPGRITTRRPVVIRDRKSTRLNSSHGSNSYAVFCLKKKTHEGKDNR